MPLALLPGGQSSPNHVCHGRRYSRSAHKSPELACCVKDHNAIVCICVDHEDPSCLVNHQSDRPERKPLRQNAGYVRFRRAYLPYQLPVPIQLDYAGIARVATNTSPALPTKTPLGPLNVSTWPLLSNRSTIRADFRLGSICTRRLLPVSTK